MPALALHSFSKAIEIPASLRNQPLDAWQTSARLSTDQNASASISLAICTDGKSLISPGKRIVVQKLCMNWICLRVARDSETGRRLVMVTGATTSVLHTVSPRQTAKG